MALFSNTKMNCRSFGKYELAGIDRVVTMTVNSILNPSITLATDNAASAALLEMVWATALKSRRRRLKPPQPRYSINGFGTENKIGWS
jgi:hypothetical protein